MPTLECRWRYPPKVNTWLAWNRSHWPRPLYLLSSPYTMQRDDWHYPYLRKEVKLVVDKNMSIRIMLYKKRSEIWVLICLRRTCVCVHRVPACVRMLGHTSIWTDEHGCIRMKIGCARMHDPWERMNTDRMGSSIVLDYHTHPKHVPTPPRTSGFHLNPSHNKT